MRYLGFAASVRIYRYSSETIATTSFDDIQVTGQDRNVKDSFFVRFCGENHDLAESREYFVFGLGITKKDSAVNCFVVCEIKVLMKNLKVRGEAP